jgi:acyl-CoA synthetase (AMP-forming)/AMP-acid ligase II
MAQTISSYLTGHTSESVAIGAVNKEWLTYGALRDLAQKVNSTLRDSGISKKDRVAIVLPNGPTMASAFATIAQCATTAPLNPNYREEEFVFYLEDLNAKAVVVSKDYEGPAALAAQRLNIQIIRLVESKGIAGLFSIEAEKKSNVIEDEAVNENDVALILHTSGTTSRPKIVPLLQSNIAASASNIAQSLSLSSSDRCMNVMPLFHIHGLIAAVSASLTAGASIWCSSGFNALSFFSNLDEAKPTWYTAVPTMHQAILARAGRNAEIIKNNPLRFLRSSSASLPAQVMGELVESFDAPVVEAYGMTEATHQMCCNRLDKQKPGSVGIPAGPSVKIAHEVNNSLVMGTGEVVISGDNVTPGYENNLEANEKSFFEIDGERWFRTGDQGAFDEDGFLYLTGRLKEIINRGGEKISPLEVDSILLDHPEIKQVVTFALPHPKLGEEVAAAVVLSEGSQSDEKDIRGFAKEKMADFKVPRQIIILDEIPKGATGKMQRIGMAEKLGLL